MNDDETPLPHELIPSFDGDGWTEPLSEAWDCACGEPIIEWVQTTPDCGDKPELRQVLSMHAAHVDEAWRSLRAPAGIEEAFIDAALAEPLPDDVFPCAVKVRDVVAVARWLAPVAAAVALPGPSPAVLPEGAA